MTKKDRKLRRFTAEEDQVLREDWYAYVPVVEIASKLNRDVGTLRQRILALGLRRDIAVAKIFKWAPDHLKKQLPQLGTPDFIKVCHDWRAEQRAQNKEARSETEKARGVELAASAAEIDQRADLTRPEKIKAKRSLGLTLRSIGRDFGISGERVRQLTKDVVRPRRKDGATVRRLRALKIVAGMKTDTDFAALLGISPARLSNVMIGAPISKDIAFRLVRKIPGLTLDWIYFGATAGLTVQLARQLAGALSQAEETTGEEADGGDQPQ